MDSKTNGATYYYAVTAVNETGESVASSVVSAVPVPPMDSSFDKGIAWLYSGDNPLQTDVKPGTIDAQRAAVLRGRVLTDDGNPLVGVKVCLLKDGNFGETLTRPDGHFDLAVNGGGQLIVCYEKEEYLPMQRQVKPGWREFAWLPDVTMIRADRKLTTLDLTADAEIQVAQGSPVSDENGQRQATLLFPKGTTAEMVLPDGTRQPLEQVAVRATEYTVGPNGPSAMPGQLPPNSGYTYCVEFTVDEALQAGAKDVRFSQPLIHYVENFLNFPVGSAVPVGYYDREQASWIPAKNGRIIQLLGVEDGLALLDIDGSGKAANAGALQKLGVTEAERRQLARLYGPPPEKSLWRVPIPHFSPWDFNWPFGAPEDAKSSDEDPNKDEANGSCTKAGSIIEIQNQVLGEAVGITGTPYALHYRSDRVRGRQAAYSLDIPLSGETVPKSLKSIQMEVFIAGQRHVQTFKAEPQQTETFTWDGRDAYGRTVQGSQTVRVRIGYVYPAIYQQPAEFEQSFARLSGIPIEGNRARQEITLWRDWSGTLGMLDAHNQGLGGWTLNMHHAFDRNAGVLYPGNRRRRNSQSFNQKITTVAGSETGFLSNGDDNYGSYGGDGGTAIEAKLNDPAAVALGPDGSLYIADSDNRRVRRVSPDGTITTIAGNGNGGFNGDGGPPTKATLNAPEGLAVAPDGTLYIVSQVTDTGGGGIYRIRRVTPGPNPVITTIAGGSQGELGDGGPAIDARLGKRFKYGGLYRGPRRYRETTGLALGPDGSLYFADKRNYRIRRIEPDGVIVTVAGTGEKGFGGDGGPALLAQFNRPSGLAVGPDGSLYIADIDNHRVRKVGPDGRIVTVAGTDKPGFNGDGILAVEAQLNLPCGVAVDRDGSLYIADSGNHRIRRIGANGVITTVAGGGDFPKSFGGDNGAAIQAGLLGSNHVALAPDGSFYISDNGNHRIRRVAPPLTGIGVGEIAIPSEDGRSLYHFDAVGRHLRTLDTLTGMLLHRFEYNDTGLLINVEDGDGNVTTIERGGDGTPLAIIGPYGQRTSLSLNANGYLTGIGNPAGESVELTYTGEGLLATFADPNENVSRFTYDELGQLVKDEDAAGGFTALARKRTDKGFQITLSTANGPEYTYLTEMLPSGAERQVNACSCGGKTVTLIGPDGSRTVTYTNGVTTAYELQLDPRFGLLAPLLKSATFKSLGGLSTSVSAARSVELGDAENPLSLATMTDTLEINGRAYTRTFDAGQKQLTYRSPEGRQHVARLDKQGRLASTGTVGLMPVSFAYDEKGRLTGAARGELAATFTYNRQGRVSTVANAAGHAAQYVYDKRGRIIQLTLPSGRTCKFDSDKNGNVTEITMPNGAVHKLSYSPVNLDTGYTSPAGDRYEVRYNKDWQVTRVKMPSGRLIENSYDHDGRLTEQKYPEATVKLAYDKTTRRVIGITRTPEDGKNAQSIKFAYDGDLVTEMTYSGAVNGRFGYRYDDNLLVTGITLDGGPEMQIERDDDGLITQRGPFTFDRGGPAGASTKITDGKLTIVIAYDKLGRLAVRTHTVAGTQVYRLALTYDNASRIKEKQETVGDKKRFYTHSYDDGQLAEVRRDGKIVERYVYDDNGNRILRQVGEGVPEKATYNEQDQLLTRGNVKYEFNADGFLVKRGGDTFTYSTRGELLKVELGSGKTVRYAYDALDRRIARIDDDGTQEYLYGNPANPFQVSAVRETSGETSIYHYDTRGRLVAVQRADQTYYVSTNQVGTPLTVSDATGQVIALFEYDSFGVPIESQGEAPGFLLGFAGGLADPATGTVRFGFRDFDSVAGRWMARAPVLLPAADVNLYRYVLNNPISRIDPSGLDVNWVPEPGPPGYPEIDDRFADFVCGFFGPLGPDCEYGYERAKWNWNCLRNPQRPGCPGGGQGEFVGPIPFPPDPGRRATCPRHRARFPTWRSRKLPLTGLGPRPRIRIRFGPSDPSSRRRARTFPEGSMR